MQRYLRFLVLAVLLSGFLAADLLAHAVGVDCTLRLGKIEVEVFYDDDSPAQKAKVQLVNAQDEVVESAVTDQLGRCVLRNPPAGNYEVRIDAGAGHRAKKKIDVPASTVQVAEPDAVVSPNEVKVSDSLARPEFTRFPWQKMLIGFVVIGTLGGAFLLGAMIRKHANAKG